MAVAEHFHFQAHWNRDPSSTGDPGSRDVQAAMQNAFISQSQAYPHLVFRPADQEEKIYTCNYCGASYASHQAYKYHVDSHQQTRSCDFCGKVLKSRTSYFSHKRTCSAKPDTGSTGQSSASNLGFADQSSASNSAPSAVGGTSSTKSTSATSTSISNSELDEQK